MVGKTLSCRTSLKSGTAAAVPAVPAAPPMGGGGDDDDDCDNDDDDDNDSQISVAPYGCNLRGAASIYSILF